MVDERDLQIKITSLRALLHTERELISKISQVLASLDAIRLKEDGTPKTDSATGTPMSETRRQEIYDICKVEAEKVISGSFPVRLVPPTPDPAQESDGPRQE